MDRFENKQFEGIYYSRFIASYCNVKGKIRYKDFVNWLRQLTINKKKLPEDVISDIAFIADNGKLELEKNCERFFAIQN